MALPPADTAPLFAPLHEALVDLLRSLSPEDWTRPTAAGAWRVRDVVAHLADTQMRRLSAHRDGYQPPLPRPITSEADVAALVHELNAGGVAFAARLSPAMLLSLIESTGPAMNAFLASLPPDGPAFWPVSWAGEAASRNWMDVGREYTERWHHQQQIRDAVGRPLLLEAPWLVPLLDISVRALPHAYRHTAAPAGTTMRLVVDAAEATTWTLRRAADGWDLTREAPGGAADVEISLSGDTAWRLFYNALPAAEAAARVQVRGRADLAAPFFETRSIVR